jgi:hypothetical protein
MVFDVIGDYHRPAASADALASEAFHKPEEGDAIESAGFTAKQEFPVSEPYRAKISHAAPRGSMQQELHQRLEFAPSAVPDRPGQLGTGLNAAETPSCRNKRWHCLTPRSISYRWAIHAAGVPFLK